jgi:cytosine deaminase
MTSGRRAGWKDCRLSRFAQLLTGGRVQKAGAKRPESLDIAIAADGRIAEISPGIDRSAAAMTIDLKGRLVVAGLVDAHQHLDKSGTRAVVSNPAATLEGASAAYRDYAAVVTQQQIAARARKTLERCLALGTVAIRSHTNIESQSELRGVEAMIELRESNRDGLTLQVVAHLTSDAPRLLPQSRQWLEGAIAAGTDVIGGVPQYADDPLAFLDLLFEFAERSGLPLDLHIDEHLDPDRIVLDAVIERTRAHGMQGRVTAGHCCSLSVAGAARAKSIIEGLLEAGISVITLPAANLFLQGRGASPPPPRGLTLIRDLRAAGVPVAAASDNIQDPFVPTGSGDLLEIARWTLLAGHFGLSDLRAAFDLVSSVPASILGLGDSYGLRPGARADLLISHAEDIDDLVATGATNRAVMVGGRLVAGSL